MADGMTAASDIKVSRSGTLHLVARGDVGRLVDPDSGWSGKPAPVQSILAHCNAQDPWEPVDPADWPGPVREAAEALPRPADLHWTRAGGGVPVAEHRVIFPQGGTPRRSLDGRPPRP